jgi:hypothetical protein
MVAGCSGVEGIIAPLSMCSILGDYRYTKDPVRYKAAYHGV